jgi:hypothetical protein
MIKIRVDIPAALDSIRGLVPARALPAPWRPVPLLALWFAAGLALSTLTARASDWFDMTDELRYERLAISIARTHSLVPQIHGVEVKSYSQLYPLLIAPIFAHGLVAHDLVQAHVLNAWLMTSACVPAYLLARYVGLRRHFAYLVAALSVVMPWIVYSTMLMTEVAAYPAFVWVVLALCYSTTRRSITADLLAFLGLAFAFFARSELLALVFVLPVAIIACELGRTRGRVAKAVRATVRGHRLLTAAYAALLVAVIAVDAEGKLTSVFGVYGTNAHPSTLLSPSLVVPFTAHVALFALGFALFPFLIGSAWLLASTVRAPTTPERHAFASVGAFTMMVLFLHATNFDVNDAGGFQIQDRYLLYLVVPILIAFCCALETGPQLRWSLLAPVAVVVCGFAVGTFPKWQRSATLATDSPASGLLRRVVGWTHTLSEARIALVVMTLALALLFVAGTILLGRSALTVAATVFVLAALVGTTAAAFGQLFGARSWSGRPLTASEAGVFDWVDRAVGPNASVTVIPYLVSSDYFVSELIFRDLEFWNKSVVRDALASSDDAYGYVGIWFPKLRVAFDAETGRANLSPTNWAIVSDKETRFGLAGAVRTAAGDLRLVDADRPWRAEWVSFGLYDDGWTKPGVTARLRIFAAPGQHRPVVRRFAFAVRAPADVASRRVRIVSNIDRWAADVTPATATESIAVCVPARGYTEIRVRTPVASQIPGDVSTLTGANGSRRGGVFFGAAALAGEVGGGCIVRP